MSQKNDHLQKWSWKNKNIQYSTNDTVSSLEIMIIYSIDTM